MIKYQIFVSKYLPAQAPRNEHQQRTCDLLKLVNKDTAVIINILFQRCCYHFFGMILRCIWLLLLFIPYHKWCNVHSMPSFKAQHCIFSNSSVDNFLGNFSKTSLHAYFKLTSDISLKSAKLKNHQRKPWCKTLEYMIFLYCFNNKKTLQVSS